jgi:hypothetical protein
VKAKHLARFVRVRPYLPQQRIGRIALAHPRDEAARHEQRKVGGGARQRVIGQIE